MYWRRTQVLDERRLEVVRKGMLAEEKTRRKRRSAADRLMNKEEVVLVISVFCHQLEEGLVTEIVTIDLRSCSTRTLPRRQPHQLRPCRARSLKSPLRPPPLHTRSPIRSLQTPW